MVNPLAIIQARFASTRLPGKMILPVAGRPLIWYAWRRSVEAFGEENVVIAIPFTDDNAPLIAICERFGARVFTWDGPEDDVLGRLWHCAYTYRWHPHSVICRVTPDDPWKGPELMRRVAAGERHPVELSCEAVTLSALTWLQVNVTDPVHREHLTHILAPTPPPEAPPGRIWTIDTEADLLEARRIMEAS